MPKYIEANYLLDRAVPHGWSTPKWVSEIVIEDAPPADVRENIHGMWIIDEDGNLECNVCGHHGVGDLYCERCGAIMDEGEDNETN